MRCHAGLSLVSQAASLIVADATSTTTCLPGTSPGVIRLPRIFVSSGDHSHAQQHPARDRAVVGDLDGGAGAIDRDDRRSRVLPPRS